MKISREAAVKEKELNRKLGPMGKTIVAFSGGLDSSYLLYKAVEAVGRDNVLAVTVNSEFFQEEELKQTISFTKKYNLKHIIVNKEHLNEEVIRKNPPDRCYYCKKQIYSELIDLSLKEQYDHVIEGSNYDDLEDYRPGLRAIEELGIDSPLRMVGLKKEEIRCLSRVSGLETWDILSVSCLASRFPYGEEITLVGLERVFEAEKFLRDLGVRGDMRVRSHAQIGRIEVSPKYFKLVTLNSEKIADKLFALGFKYVTLDLKGFYSGSMNIF